MVTRHNTSVMKVVVVYMGIHVLNCLQEELAWLGLLVI